MEKISFCKCNFKNFKLRPRCILNLTKKYREYLLCVDCKNPIKTTKKLSKKIGETIEEKIIRLKKSDKSIFDNMDWNNREHRKGLMEIVCGRKISNKEYDKEYDDEFTSKGPLDWTDGYY